MGCTPSQNKRSEVCHDSKQLMYVSADPDLGWRNITDIMHYPFHGWRVDFMNERSENVLDEISLVNLALNIAHRSVMLAEKYGISNPEESGSSSNILSLLEGSKASVPDNGLSLHQALGIPRYRWKLVNRMISTQELTSTDPQFFGDDGPEKHVQQYLQVLTNPDGQDCVVDVAEVGINIAEQLFRLEKTDNSRTHKSPNHAFGWSVLPQRDLFPAMLSGLSVANPEGEAFLMTPEVIIMDVASWIQATYLTAPVF